MVEGTGNLPTDSWLVWEVPDKPVSVRLRRDVVARLGMAVREGFKALPKRGLETGGLLIGSKVEAEGGVFVSIYDFEAVDSEHATGPSYLLSSVDRRLLESRIAALKPVAGPLSIVGFYRSHTRPDFAITPEDAELFATYFGDASDVFLLIKSNDNGAPTGGFIIRENGAIVSCTPYLQFPFPLNTMAGVPPMNEQSVPIEPDPSPDATAVVQPGPRLPRDWAAGWRTRAAAAGAMVLAVALPFGIQRGIPGPTTAEKVPPLALNVSSTGNGLRLSWNHPALQTPARAVLWITDGQEEQRFDLDARQLGEGSVAYWPRNNDVTFRMEVRSHGATVAESVRSIGQPPIPPAAEEPQPIVESSSAPAVEVPTEAVPHRNRPGAESRRTSRAFVPPPTKQNPLIAASAFPDPPAPHPMIIPPLERNNELTKLMESGSRPSSEGVADASVRVRVEPPAGSRLEHLAHSLPLIGKGRRTDYVPPVPLHGTEAIISPHPKVARDVAIDVKVYVDPSGKVEYAEMLSKMPMAEKELAVWAVFAAKKWQFIPARTAEGAVPGEMILHYQFDAGPPVGR